MRSREQGWASPRWGLRREETPQTGPVVDGAAGERQALAQGSTTSGQHTAELFRSPHGSLAAAVHMEWVRNRGSDLESRRATQQEEEMLGSEAA